MSTDAIIRDQSHPFLRAFALDTPAATASAVQVWTSDPGQPGTGARTGIICTNIDGTCSQALELCVIGSGSAGDTVVVQLDWIDAVQDPSMVVQANLQANPQGKFLWIARPVAKLTATLGTVTGATTTPANPIPATTFFASTMTSSYGATGDVTVMSPTGGAIASYRVVTKGASRLRLQLISGTGAGNFNVLYRWIDT